MFGLGQPACRNVTNYLKNQNVSICPGPGTRATVTSLQNSSTPGLKQPMSVEPNENYQITIYGFKKTDTPVLGWVADINNNTIIFSTANQLTKTPTYIRMNINSGNNRALMVGLLFRNPIKGDSFVINQMYITKLRI